MGLDEGKLVQEWELKTGQAVNSVNELAKVIRQEQAHEKKLQLIRADLDKQSGKLTAATNKLSKSIGDQSKTFTVASVKGNLYAMAIAAMATATKSAIKDGLNWEDWIGKTGASLDGASDAVSGMIDKLELQGVKMRLTAGDFNATEKQIRAMGVAAVTGGRIMRQDFGATLRQLTEEIVAGGEGTVFRRLGIDVQLLGTKAEKTAKAIKIIEDRFADVHPTVDNTNEAVDAAGAAWKNLTAEFIAAAVAGGTLKGVLEGLTAALKAGQGKGIVSDADLAGAFKKSPFKTWEAEQIARGVSAAEGGLSGAIGDRTSAMILANQKAMLKAFRGGKKGGGKVAKGEFTPATKVFSVDDIEKIEAQDREAAVLPVLIRLQRELAAAEFDRNEQTKAGVAILDEQLAAYEKTIAASELQAKTIRDTKEEIKDMTVGALANFTAGLWASADAAIMGSETLGMAIAKTTKDVLLGMAQQATVKGMMAMADYVISWGANAAALSAAGMYFAVAAVAGGAGLGVSAGIKSAGGYDTKESEKTTTTPTRSQSFGTKKDLSPTFYINLYMQPSKNGAAQFIGNQQFVAQLGLAKAA